MVLTELSMLQETAPAKEARYLSEMPNLGHALHTPGRMQVKSTLETGFLNPRVKPRWGFVARF
jgi:hypothetical protein